MANKDNPLTACLRTEVAVVIELDLGNKEGVLSTGEVLATQAWFASRQEQIKKAQSHLD